MTRSCIFCPDADKLQDSHATLQAYIKMCSESDQGNVKKSRIESADHEVNDQDDCHSLGDEDS